MAVNNAARMQTTPLMQISTEEFSQVVGVNLTGTFHSCQVLGGHLAGRGYGRIINMGSLAGQNGGTATGGHYAASKGGIHTLTKVFARELAGSGVTVNTVSPGSLDLPSSIARYRRSEWRRFWRPFPWESSVHPNSSHRSLH